jgi:hypothetical protein
VCAGTRPEASVARGNATDIEGFGVFGSWQSVCLLMHIMAIDEIDREEVDRLVKEMAARRRAPVAAPAPPSMPKITSGLQQTDSPQSASASPIAQTPKASRWSTNRLLMPSLQRASRRKDFALASVMTMNMPALPKIGLPDWTETQWAVLTARMFVALGVALGAAMPYWPYTTAGPWSLGLYLSAVILVIVTGIWGSKLTWDARLARAHTIAIVTIMWGLILVAAVVLPKMGLPH